MALHLILQAAEYIDYSDSARARGEEPLDVKTYCSSTSFLKKTQVADQDSSCDPSTSYSLDGKFSFFKNAEGPGHREVHNRLEKNRREMMKQYFQNLKNLLPEMIDEKVSSVSVLQKAKKYIEKLEEENVHLREERRKQNKRHRKLQRTLRHLKREITVKIRGRWSSADYCSDGETTTTASECGDSSDESIVDQIKGVNVSRSGTKDYCITGTPRQPVPVPFYDEKCVRGSYEQGSILLARLSEEVGNNCKDVQCEASSTFRKTEILPKESPGDNSPLLHMSSRINGQLDYDSRFPVQLQKNCAEFQNSGFFLKKSPWNDVPVVTEMNSNTPIDCGENSPLQVKREQATIKTSVPFPRKKSSETKNEMHLQTSGSLCHGQPLGEKEMTSDALCGQPRQLGAIETHAEKKFIHDNKLKLHNTDPATLHSTPELIVKSRSTDSLNTLNTSQTHETVIKPPSTKTTKSLCSALETPAVIQNGGESLLKSIRLSSQVYVPRESSVVASYTNKFARKFIKSSDDKSFSMVSQVKRNCSAVPVYVVSSSAAGTGVHLPHPNRNDACSYTDDFDLANIISIAEEGHISEAPPDFLSKPYLKFYAKK